LVPLGKPSTCIGLMKGIEMALMQKNGRKKKKENEKSK
jgi:hypothetical protein